ncbi:MAG: porphobilinogen synthase [Candidatus Xenobium sp.]|jgi:porphobilinogen synthase|nr:porphobilinogen synthase [Burkholderiales bacterium]
MSLLHHFNNAPQAGFPQLRLRRMRRSAELRSMVRETRLDPAHFIYPLFVVEGEGIRREIPAMPGQFHLSVDELVREAASAFAEGVPAVLLFGIPATKDPRGTSAADPQGPVARAVRELKRELPRLLVVTDVCLCEYTDHGHCGLLDGQQVDNDATLPVLAETALAHARAGADMVAPSDMMDGRVQAIRARLDQEGFDRIPILAYAAKFASAFYGPFREAAQSAPQFGDRRSYQMDPANRREALREVQADLQEGADLVMVKPALAFLDVLREVRDEVTCPLAAYNVSGEYSMVKAAARMGWIDERAVTLEILTGIKRAGADLILTYHAREAARWLA